MDSELQDFCSEYSENNPTCFAIRRAIEVGLQPRSADWEFLEIMAEYCEEGIYAESQQVQNAYTDNVEVDIIIQFGPYGRYDS